MDTAFPTTDSFMYQTIHRQPDDLRVVLETAEEAEQAASVIAGASRIWITGIGTSYHAALVGGWLLRAAGRDARAVTSFDFATYPEQFPLGANDAVIIQAHTGVKSYSALALQRAVATGARVISIGSQSAEHPGSWYVLRTCEREKSAAYTSSHLCAMARLAQLAIGFGATFLQEPLEALPAQIAGVIDREDAIEPVARDAARRHIYAIGAGPNEPTALEFVIKAREAALQPCDGIGLEQFFHGPIVAVNEGDFGLFVSVTGPSAGRTAAIAGALAELGCAVWSTGDFDPRVPGATHFAIPPTHELISPLLTVVPIQIFAYHLAAARGTHPDRFRREDPLYADAFGLLTL
jgi:glucosamine--fructose-6-phosphate aminotransferase (isomerizing)